jgi:hypothetical protein
MGLQAEIERMRHDKTTIVFFLAETLKKSVLTFSWISECDFYYLDCVTPLTFLSQPLE